MEAEEPALALDSVERRVPFDRLAYVGDGARDERVESAPDVALPARHGRDVGLHRSVTVGLLDLGIAAREESRLPGGHLRGLAPLPGRHDGVRDSRPAHGSLPCWSTSFTSLSSKVSTCRSC